MKHSRIPALMVFLLAICLLWSGFSDLSRSSRRKSRDLTLKAIDRAVVNCYAIEGRYPPDFAYLEKNYGVRVNRSKYLVDYQVFASNVKPAVQLLERGGDQKEEQP